MSFLILNSKVRKGATATDLAINVAAYYALEEASGTREDTKGGYDMDVEVNSVTNTAGIIGNAALGATTAYVYRDNADIAALFGGATKFSLNFWHNQTGATNRSGIFRYSNDRFSIMFLKSGADTNMSINMNGSSVRYAAISGMGYPATHMVTIVYDGGGAADADRLKVYVNAVEKTGGTSIPTSISTGTDNKVYLGDAQGWKLDGWLDEVSLFLAYALSAADITRLYNGGAALALADF